MEPVTTDLPIEPLSSSEYEHWSRGVLDNWANQRSFAQHISYDAAFDLASEIFNRFLPDGADTPANYIRQVFQKGNPVGVFWLMVKGEAALIPNLDPELDEDLVILLELVENYARNLGAKTIRISVFQSDLLMKSATSARDYGLSGTLMGLDLENFAATPDEQSTIDLQPMSESEFQAFRAHSVSEYAKAMLRSRAVSEADAEDQSEASFQRLLPDGKETADQLIMTVRSENQVVGHLWIAMKSDHGRREAFGYDMELIASARGKGLGRELMNAAHALLHKSGVSRVGLNVFGHNKIAQNLYQSLGYKPMEERRYKDL